MNVDVTRAATWSEDFTAKVLEYLEGVGFDDIADEVRRRRAEGEEGLAQWQEIEAAADALDHKTLAKVGRGPHLLEQEPISPAVTTTKSSSSTTAEDSE